MSLTINAGQAMFDSLILYIWGGREVDYWKLFGLSLLKLIYISSQSVGFYISDEVGMKIYIYIRKSPRALVTSHPLDKLRLDRASYN